MLDFLKDKWEILRWNLNIGAGRIVYQDLAKINLACEDNSIAKKENLQKALNYQKKIKSLFILLV